MTRYQERMNQFVWTGRIYSIGCGIGLWWNGALGSSWLIFASTLTLIYCLAVGCDAVYASLSERLPNSLRDELT